MHEFLTAINGTGTTLIVMLLAIFLGIWLNRRDVNQLGSDMRADINLMRGDMNLLQTSLRGEMNLLQTNLRGEMASGFAKVDARFNATDARIDRIHNDFSNFHHTLGQHDARLDALENE